MRYPKRVSFSPDGTKLGLAPGRRTGSVGIWDLSSNALQCELHGHESWVSEVLFHPTEPDIVASCSLDQTIRIWNWKEEKLIRRMTGQASDITSMTFTRDGQRLVSGSKDGRVMVWNVKDDSPADLIPRAYTIGEPLFSPSGNLVNIIEWTGIYAPTSVDAVVLSYETREEAASKPPSLSKMELSEERHMVDIKLRMVVIDEQTEMPKTGRDEMVIGRAPDGSLRFKVFLPDGGIIVDKTESDFDQKGAEILALKEALSGFWGKTALTDDQRIEFATAVFEIDQDTPPQVWRDTIYETSSGKALWEVSSKERALDFSPEESTLLTLNTNRVFFRKPLTGELVRTVNFKEPIWNVNFRARGPMRWFDLSPDGSSIAVTELEPAIRVIDVESGDTKAVFDERHMIIDVGFVPNGDQVIFRSFESFGIWNPTTNKKILLTGNGASRVTWMDVSPDSRTVAAVCKDNAVRIWRLEDGRLERTIRGLRENLSKIAFTPDGKSFALIRSREPKITFWNTRTWRQVAAIDRVPNTHDAMSFSPDGKVLMMSGRGGTRIWRAPMFEETDNETAFSRP